MYRSLKCIDPYVDDDGECSLDTDGDSTPDYRVSTVMDQFYMHNCQSEANTGYYIYSNNAVSFVS